MFVDHLEKFGIFLISSMVLRDQQIQALKVVRQIEKALADDRLAVSKVSWKFSIPTI